MRMTDAPDPKTILVADDDPAIIDAICFMLEDEGYEVCCISDGNVAAKMAQKRPDLLLLDIWMSGKDGRDICKQLKQQDATKQIPIIIFSANRDCEEMARTAGADDFLCKPFEMDELLSKIAKYTQN